MLSVFYCFSLTDLGELHSHHLIPSHASLWLLWLSCIKWEHMSGSKSRCKAQLHRDSVPRHDSLIFPFPCSCVPMESAARHMALIGLPAPASLSPIHIQSEVHPLQEWILQVATCPQMCSCMSCPHIVQGAELAFVIWKGARGAGEPIQPLVSQIITRARKNQTIYWQLEINERRLGDTMALGSIWIWFHSDSISYPLF